MSTGRPSKYKRLLITEDVDSGAAGADILAKALRKRLGAYLQVVDTTYNPPALIREDYTPKDTDIVISTKGFLVDLDPQHAIDVIADQIYAMIKETHRYAT